MNEIYLSLADAFKKLADGFEALAKAGPVVQSSDVETVNEPKKDNPVDIETVRAVLADKSREGKTKEIKTLLIVRDIIKITKKDKVNFTN